MSVLAVTTALTVLQYPFPQVRTALWRDPELIAAGQWWRLVTALFVQYDAAWQIVVVLACIAAVGVLAERIFGPGWWLVIYLGCGVVGQVFGCLWEPPDAGASVAGAGLLGAVSAWLLWRTGAARSPTWPPPPVPGSRHPQSAADRERGWALASTTSRPGGATLGGERPHGLKGGLR